MMDAVTLYVGSALPLGGSMTLQDDNDVDLLPLEGSTPRVRFPDRLPGASSPAAERRMKATRRRGTKAEQLVCANLDELELQYEVDRAPIQGLRRRADICFPEAQIAVFIDGCFWHSCPLHGTSPKANHEWWEAKLEANCQRDADTNRILSEAGWTVLRFWAHEPAGDVAQTIVDVLARRTFDR